MKIRQKLIFSLVIFFGILLIGIDKAQATSLTLSPSSGVAGSSFTISGSGFTPFAPATAVWDSASFGVTDVAANETGDYSASAQVPSDAVAGGHSIKVTSASVGMMYGPKKNWFARIFTRAQAGEDVTASAVFTVTAPPETPPPANTNNTSTNSPQGSTNTNTNTQVSKKTNTNTNQVVTEPESAAPTVTTDAPEPIVQSEPINEVKEGAEMCYFPWWLWLVLILITAINLALFWIRYWKKKPKESEQEK